MTTTEWQTMWVYIYMTLIHLYSLCFSRHQSFRKCNQILCQLKANTNKTLQNVNYSPSPPQTERWSKGNLVAKEVFSLLDTKIVCLHDMLPPWDNIHFTIPGLYTDYSPPPPSPHLVPSHKLTTIYLSQTKTNASKTEGGADQTGLFRLERVRDSISWLSKAPVSLQTVEKRGQPVADHLPQYQYQNPAITTVDLRLTSTCWHCKQNLSNHKHKKWGQQEAAALLTTSCAITSMHKAPFLIRADSTL